MRFPARLLWLPLPLLALCPAIYLSYAQRALDGWDTMAYVYAGRQLASAQGLATTDPKNETIGLAFHLGDAISFYGNRSVLYYRHMSRPEQPDGSSRPVEERLTEAIDRLLARGTPVYFVDDARYGISPILYIAIIG